MICPTKNKTANIAGRRFRLMDASKGAKLSGKLVQRNRAAPRQGALLEARPAPAAWLYYGLGDWLSAYSFGIRGLFERSRS